MRAGNEVIIEAAVKDILREMKVKNNPDAVLKEVRQKLPHRESVKSLVTKQGTFKNPQHEQILELAVAKGCGQPTFFAKKKTANENAQKLVALKEQQDDEQKTKEQNKAAAKLQQHIDNSVAHTANLNLKDYSEQNLRALAKGHGNRVNAAMAAAVYDPKTQRYFVGKSGEKHTNANGIVPAKIWRSIKTEVNADNYAFGTSCAEVDCLVKLFVERKAASVTDQDLQGVYFAAYTGNGKAICRGPCLSCNGWTRDHGATCLKA